jgi:hypothetical protein
MPEDFKEPRPIEGKHATQDVIFELEHGRNTRRECDLC